MGKVGSPRRPRNESNKDGSLFGAKEYHRCVEGRREQQWSKNMEATKYKGKSRHHWVPKHARSIVFMLGLMGFLFLLDSLMVSVFHSMHLEHSSTPTKSSVLEEASGDHFNKRKAPVQMYSRLLDLASTSLAEKEFKRESSNYWEEPYPQASTWKPCAAEKSSSSRDKPNRNNGYIVISANGGLNQQRVAICNAVAVASLLNATLVLPKFLYSNVWKDPSQFSDIYQDDYFMKVLKDDINIVKDLPPRLKALDIEAIGSLITDADIVKEAKPDDYFRVALPLLLQNGVVHFLGYGNRLGFDSLPFNLQRLRCKCNFHALKFVPKIQETGSLLVRRIRKYEAAQSMLDRQLLGNFIPVASKERDAATRPSKYLALHMRFEMDMVAYSFCEFGGGEMEQKELQAYRELHFPLVLERLRKSKPPSPAKLRKIGKCPLTPEEAGLVLAALGFKRGTYIYLAGSQIYGGESRMKPFTSLYPNLVTKETLLSPTELQPFRNFSSQMAALDFIACATADVFAMTDSGSQLSSLVSGFRTYYGGGNAPNLRPNKKRLAAVLSKSRSIDWNSFEDRVRKMIEEGQRLRARGYGRSIYRQPSCPECMCKNESPF